MMKTLILKISVLSSGVVLLDGRPIDPDRLEKALEDAKEKNGAVAYYSEATPAGPSAQAATTMSLIIKHKLDVGDLVILGTAMSAILTKLQQVATINEQYQNAIVSARRLYEVLAAPPTVPEKLNAKPLPSGSGAVRFENLTFAYDDRGPALRDVTFEIRPGETVAVVGPTGSGKSTLGALLARLWEPPPGTVFLDGRDVRTLPLRALRGTIGYVPQEAFLFSRSVSDNVSLEREALDAARVRDAAVASGVAEEIEGFPRGWQTVVGERGLTLSGGQRQRVALARALAGDPSLIVLDDVFASVDAAKEDEILRQLRPRLAGRTVLLMTHRLHAAQAADRIVVLVDGRVVQQGTHDELLRADGAYAQLWRIQQLEEEIAGA